VHPNTIKQRVQCLLPCPACILIFPNNLIHDHYSEKPQSWFTS
jgi:hypothetical protein